MTSLVVLLLVGLLNKQCKTRVNFFSSPQPPAPALLLKFHFCHCKEKSVLHSELYTSWLFKHTECEWATNPKHQYLMTWNTHNVAILQPGMRLNDQYLAHLKTGRYCCISSNFGF